MNVYFAGGEDVDFAAGVLQTNNSYDVAFARSGWGPNGTLSTTGLVAGNVGNAVSFGALSTFWLHGEVLQANNNNTLTNGIVFGLSDPSSVLRLVLRGSGTAGLLKIAKRTAAGVITDLATAASVTWPAATLFKLDLFVNYSTTGRVQLYVNGVLSADTGAGVDVTTDGATNLSFFNLCNLTSGQGVGWSEIIVADSDTRAARLWTMNSTTAGNAQTWTGTASNVNKAVINDTTFISAASAGLIEEFKTGGIALPAGTYSVAAVKMSSRALGGSAGSPTRVEYVTRVGSTDYVGGTWTPPVGSFANNSNFIQAVNPATGLPWVTADLTAASFNYGVESVA